MQRRVAAKECPVGMSFNYQDEKKQKFNEEKL
jgi:hypothetical protein